MHANSDGFVLAGLADASVCPADLDASELEIGHSASPLGPLIAVGFVLTLLSASLAFGWWGGTEESHVTAGVAGVVLFGLATSCLIWMLPAQRGPIVIVGRYGIRDLRIGNEFLVWDSIAEVSGLECRGRRVVVLRLTPAMQRQLSCIKTARFASVDHVVISPQGLATDFDTLLRTCRTFHAASDAHAALQQRRGSEHMNASLAS